jgi:CMP-N,N'-diacetyllegionaminic acid synthase
MRILGLIPARGGSKGVPRKNIRLLGEKPLIAYTIESAINSKQFADIVVSTDDAEIANVAEQFGAKVPFIRPAELSTDAAKSIDVVIHALEMLENSGERYDAICLLQPTNPFRSSQFIIDAITKFKTEKVETLLSVLPVPHEYNPHWTFEINKNGYLTISTGDEIIIPRRQELPAAYCRDGSIYLVLFETIKNNRTFYGKTIGYIEADEKFHVNIDTQDDWNKAEILFMQNKI